MFVPPHPTHSWNTGAQVKRGNVRGKNGKKISESTTPYVRNLKPPETSTD